MEILNNSTISVLIGFILILIMLYLKKIHDSYQFFAKRGLKTPPITFLFGNFIEAHKDRQFVAVLREWTLKYGKTYGYFEGHQPILVTSDVNIIQEVFSKQSSNFSARKLRALDLPDNSPKVSLVTAIESRWKNMRNIINPAFSSSKLREISPFLQMCAQRLSAVLDKKANQIVDIRKCMKRFSMDTIWNCAFGIDHKIQSDDTKLYILDKSDKAINMLVIYTFVMHIPVLFSEIQPIFSLIYWSVQLLLYKISKLINFDYMHPAIWIRENSVAIMENRIKSGLNVKRRDFLNLLVDAYTENIDELQKIEKFDAETTQLKKKLSLEEIKMNLTVFITGGYETVSTALSYCLYTMAFLPAEQKKLIAEVDEYFPPDSDVDPDVDNVKQLEYMKCFINEVLRYFAVANILLMRRCVHPTVLNGIDIPKGLTVQLDAVSLHRDPELWGPVDPDEFYPERFSKENKRNPFAFVAFGAGSRNCIGMKLAYVQMQVALVNLLKKFEFEKADNTQNDLNFTKFRIPEMFDEINVFIKKRE